VREEEVNEESEIERESSKGIFGCGRRAGWDGYHV